MLIPDLAERSDASPRHGEHGAVAIVTAICISAFLLISSAMVVDLGLLRVDRQTDKSAADAASMAGVNGLVPNTNNPSFHPFAGVCQALAYLKANSPSLSSFSSTSWTDGNGAAAAVPNCTNLASPDPRLCTSATPSTWARFTGTTSDGRSVVTIQSGYTVTGGNIATVTGGDFPEEQLPSYQNDTGAPDPSDPSAVDYGGCEQLAVIVSDVRNTSLGAQAASKMRTRIRSVGRVTISPPQSPFALLILDQSACLSLANTSNGSIDVLGYKSHPGMIHADSNGTGSQCGAKQVMQGAKPAGIVAHEAPDTNAPGAITMVATSNQIDSPANVYAGPAPGTPPTTRGLVTRSVLDTIYRQGVANAMTSAGFAWTSAAGGTAPDASWTTVGCTPTSPVTATKVFVKCNNFNNSVAFPNATDLIFTGQIASDNITMPVARNVYVVGGTSPAGISVGSTFAMNNNGIATCPTSTTPTGQRARLFIENGNLVTAGGSFFEACNTTVMLLGGQSNGCVPTSNGTYFADDKPCSGTAGTGQMNMTGNGTIEWTAPNLDDDAIQAPAADHLLLEDLALWTESGGVHTLGGGGNMHLAGVFAAPNAMPMKLNGGTTQNVKNSQYVVRQLWTTGSSALQMQPLPSLPVAPPTVTFNLVR